MKTNVKKVLLVLLFCSGLTLQWGNSSDSMFPNLAITSSSLAFADESIVGDYSTCKLPCHQYLELDLPTT